MGFRLKGEAGLCGHKNGYVWLVSGSWDIIYLSCVGGRCVAVGGWVKSYTCLDLFASECVSIQRNTSVCYDPGYLLYPFLRLDPIPGIDRVADCREGCFVVT